ncbi:hypothetical protein QBC34DRAFT_447939 [Podospora aff. communis PSN243]|uniref:Cell wall mannoprotein PIR1-like C-terminal domain-containing protein n=1 Tax=Podospora aff. communis PSN243 TaxID=3040156 RepID=A0AAV9GRR6_9PEZI|nr:hypothetical protein QBC34DRAFT_447939 [Podospora aff. communis PSN243]
MAKSSRLLFTLGALLTGTLADHGTGADFGSNCCKFTLSSTGEFDCPAGELLDGQIRLNGTYDTSTFCLDSQGGITNSRGFGCIVTDQPTTQIQCDQGKKPTHGFSIGTNNTLLYHGSPSFFACPATDTEYNIYVSPNFGQTKCFPITLQSDGCGAQECPPASTVWQTAWYTQVINQTIMLTQTELVPCSTPPPAVTSTPPAVPSTNATKPCNKSKCHGAPWQNHTSPDAGAGAPGVSTVLPVSSVTTDVVSIETNTTAVVRRKWFKLRG